VGNEEILHRLKLGEYPMEIKTRKANGIVFNLHRSCFLKHVI